MLDLELGSKLLLNTNGVVSLIGLCNISIGLLLRCSDRWNLVWTLSNGTSGPFTAGLLEHLTDLVGSGHIGMIVVTVGYQVVRIVLSVLL